MKIAQLLFAFIFMISSYQENMAQIPTNENIPAGVDFNEKLRDWDGFGFNYVETAHTYHYNEFPQEYGGFSLLSEQQKQEIIQLIFGEEGLKVGLIKMFLGANHQKEAYGPYDHLTTTSNMLYFVKEGLKVTRLRAVDLEIITTLYGPPGFMTLQKDDRGRDLDPKFKTEMANYMIDWVKFLKEQEKLPVKYLSLHNEGEDWTRWNKEGFSNWKGHDYNLFWSTGMVNDYLALMPSLLKKAGLSDVKVTPGETSNWYRFTNWNYAHEIANHPEALKNLGLITSHGFYNGVFGRWFGENNSIGIDLIRSKRPDLHAWVTSTSWSKMDANNIKEMHGNIYTTKVNGIIPWAGIQRPTHWLLGDPNPGCAILVKEDGSYEVTKGYYYYKQISRAGQAGAAIAHTYAADSEVALIGFANNGTKNHDAFVVVNTSKYPKNLNINVQGTAGSVFEAFRTADAEDQEPERYARAGDYKLENNHLIYTAPPGSVTTFFAK